MKMLVFIMALMAAPAFAQNTGTVQQPGGANRTGTIQQSTVALIPPARSGPAPAIRQPSSTASGGTADSAAQPSGTVFHQMLPVK